MLCPFCGHAMRHGNIYGSGSVGVYWLPEGQKSPVTTAFSFKKRIKEAGGIVIDQLGPLSFAKKKPISFYCGTCGCFLVNGPASGEDSGFMQNLESTGQ